MGTGVLNTTMHRFCTRISKTCARWCAQHKPEADLPEWVVSTGNPVIAPIGTSKQAAANAARAALQAANFASKCAAKQAAGNAALAALQAAYFASRCAAIMPVCESAPPGGVERTTRAGQSDEWCVIGDRPHSV